MNSNLRGIPVSCTLVGYKRTTAAKLNYASKLTINRNESTIDYIETWPLDG